MSAHDDALARIAELRAVVEAADKGGRPWEWRGGYPQQVIRIGDAMLVAETYEGPDFPSTIAEFIVTFDPPTLIGFLTLAETVLERHESIAYGESVPGSWCPRCSTSWPCAEAKAALDALGVA